jgi:D-lactate dehydrogenase
LSTDSTQAFLSSLRAIIGGAHLISAPPAMRRFCTGFRGGTGAALAVVRPGSLLELWRVLGACVGEGKIVLLQAANTGLTGGSTPAEGGYDRELVVISTLRLARIFLLEGPRGQLPAGGPTNSFNRGIGQISLRSNWR